jgi:Wax ester synthase-like Acyl-CoA acyltransferase domain
MWEIWILEGPANPAYFVMISKVHHCMVDGMSSVDLLNVLLRPEPTQVLEPLPGWIPRPAPSRWSLATEALGRYVRLPLDMARSFPQISQEVRDPPNTTPATPRQDDGLPTDTDLQRALTLCGLAHLASRLDEEQNWSQRQEHIELRRSRARG